MKGIKNIRESFKTRQVKYGGYAALITLAVIAGLILVNLLVGQFSPQIDLTDSKLFSLSEQTMQVLEKVNTPVTFYGMWKPGDENPSVMPVVELYLAKNSNISFEMIDPDRNPAFVLKYDPEKRGIQRGSLIVEGEKGFKVIDPYDMYDFMQNQQGQFSVTGIAVEHRITSALLYAGTGTTPVVYELTGHGEIPLVEIGMTEVLSRENLSLQSLNLLLEPIPGDASVIILNGPRRDIARDEADKLLDYLGNGGRLIVLTSYFIGDLTNVNEVMASYGLKFEFGVVRETNPNYVAIDLRSEWPDLADHDITKPLMNKASTPVVLLEAMAISELPTKRRSIEIIPLMTTSAEAFFRTDLSETSAEKTASDISGPFTMAMAVTDPSWIDPNKPEPQARIVAVGCGDLLPIALSGFEANRDVFMNSLMWLADQPESISMRSKSTFILPLRLNLLQIVIFGALFVLIIPLTFFIVGLVTWLKRRHL